VSATTTYVTVRCPQCGDKRQLTTRQRRRVVNSGGELTCAQCPHGRPDGAQEYRDWWLERRPQNSS
jgi:predicted RNA-binding Zn-ribbon protein involved in translation (DUF1610 family)